jgi:hypothetical protein
MKRAVAFLMLMLAGCGLQSNYTLVMTTLAENGGATGLTAIEGYRSKEICPSAGNQWRNSLPNIGEGSFTCLEPRQ